MSTRKATYVTLDELMDEVGDDVTRYFFLMRRADAEKQGKKYTVDMDNIQIVKKEGDLTTLELTPKKADDTDIKKRVMVVDTRYFVTVKGENYDAAGKLVGTAASNDTRRIRTGSARAFRRPRTSSSLLHITFDGPTIPCFSRNGKRSSSFRR